MTQIAPICWGRQSTPVSYILTEVNCRPQINQY
jgi:hypothetical protein